MMNKKHKEHIIILVGSGLGSLLILITLTIYGSVSKYDILNFLNGVSIRDLAKLLAPSPVINTDCKSNGIFVNNPYPIENQFHRSVRDKNIKKKTEVVTYDLSLKQRAVIIITAVLKCRYRIGESHPNHACAISKIYIDKIEGSTDTSNSTGLLDSLSSSTTDIKILNPGSHEIRVEGIFYSYDDNPHVDVEMKFTLINCEDMPIKGIHTNDKNK